MDALAALFGDISDWLYTYILIALLVGTGLYFTIRTGGVQFREFGQMVRGIFGSRNKDGDNISSFQAFAIGLASRVGTGNIAGVAIALVAGGPGAIFWMWLVALVGMATAFIEATLAQLFKIRWHDGTFRGGPAFFIEKGLGSRTWGAIFAVILIFTFGISFEMAQANTIAGTFESNFGIPVWATALGLVIISAPIVFGGIKRVAKVAEILAPAMALVYIALAIVIIVINYDQIIPVFKLIIASAFNLQSGVAGTAGGIVAAMLNGARRGLFSNEAGMGSAPNAASTAQVTHPAKQGFIQSIGVFVDTMLVCSATAFIVLNAAPNVFTPGTEPSEKGASLTIAAAQSQLGDWVGTLLVVLIFVFAFSSIIGNYTYAQVNFDFLTGGKPWGEYALRTAVLASIAIGSLASLEAVWNFADITMGGMALINLVAILLLGKWALGALKDYRVNPQRPFVATNNPNMPGELPTDVWVERENPLA